MLTITVPSIEAWDEKKEEFVIVEKETTIVLEHSLVSISKWESKWHKPFLNNNQEKTNAELIDYVRCMTVTKNIKPDVYFRLSKENLDDISSYIDDTMTATWFSDDKKKKPTIREIITSEVIYYWMVQFNIPFECEKWHLNRLLTLIRVCNAKLKKPEKRSNREMLASRAALNAARKKKLNTRG